MLKEKVTKALEGVSGRISIVLKDLSKDIWILKNDENRVFPSASTIKILIMIEALKQVEEGKFNLDEKIKINGSDRVDYSIISELDIEEYTFKDLITLMIIISDNTATNVLIDLLSVEKINIIANNLGLKNTVLRRKMMDFESAKKGRENETCAMDMAIIMEKIYSNLVLTKEMCNLMIDILKRQKHDDSLRRYLCEDVVIAHKTGELNRLNHDIGIFYLEDIDYTLGVFITNAIDNLEAKRTIGKISKIVYDYYNEG